MRSATGELAAVATADEAAPGGPGTVPQAAYSAAETVVIGSAGAGGENRGESCTSLYLRQDNVPRRPVEGRGRWHQERGVGASDAGNKVAPFK